jgi:hypothetical protein
VEVDAGRVLAFRVAGQGLAGPDGREPRDVLGSWAVQDSPPGAAVAAVLARSAAEVSPGFVDASVHDERSAVALYNARPPTAVVPVAEAPAFGTALLPGDDAGLKAIVASAVPDRAEGFAEPVALAVDAVSDALDGTVLSRDDLHEELRARLPGALLPWCNGCQSHHARRGLLVMAGLHGRLCVAGRAGRQPAFARTDQWAGWDAPPAAEAGAALVRRYLAAYGPSAPGELAQWAGLGNAHARAVWALVADELVEVAVGGRRGRAWLLAADADRLADPPAAPGVRLLAPGDPLLLGRDRETLLPSEELRRAVWKPIGGAGVVLAEGAPAALWRARKRGRRLDVTVEAFGRVPRAAVQAGAERLAPHRGCSSVALEWAS